MAAGLAQMAYGRSKGMRIQEAAALGVLAGAGLTAACLKRSAWERSSLRVAEYTLHSNKLRGGERVFVFLSDLHDACFGADNAALIQKIEDLRPDAVLIGGDMMTVKKTAEIGLTLSLARRLAERWPLFYAEGNHESRLNRDRGRYGALYDELRAELSHYGVCFLRDESVRFGEDIEISGLFITENYYRRFHCDRMRGEYLSAHLGVASEGRYHILMAHSPQFFEAYAAWGADLTLAGHFHGGTIQLPGQIGLMTPQFQLFERRVTGLHRLGHSSMIVSPGLGTHSIRLRINNPPQIVAVHLKGAEKEWQRKFH